MCHRLLSDARFHAHLSAIDADLASSASHRACSLCGGVLHVADYPRKPRGLPVGMGSVAVRRHSFCCGSRDCRKRLTPASVRFLCRRVYVSVVVVLAATLAQGLSGRRTARLCRELEVDERTLARWRAWWQQELPRSEVWAELRGRLDRPVDPLALPASLLQRITGRSAAERLLSLLRLLSPFSHSALMRARFSRVA